MSPTIADIVPGLAEGHARRAILQRTRRRLAERGIDGDIEAVARCLEARGLGPAEVIAVMAEGGWGGWARARSAVRRLPEDHHVSQT